MDNLNNLNNNNPEDTNIINNSLNINFNEQQTLKTPKSNYRKS
jgi:hypothetical protein